MSKVIKDKAFSMAVQAVFAYSAGSDKEALETFEWIDADEAQGPAPNVFFENEATKTGEQKELDTDTQGSKFKAANFAIDEKTNEGTKINFDSKEGTKSFSKLAFDGEGEGALSRENSLEGAQKGADDKKALDKEALKSEARLLFCGTIDNLDEIDGAIKANLTKAWTIERMNKVVLATVRVAAFLLLYQKEVEVGKVVDKAIATAKSYTETHSTFNKTAGFVNAILDKIAKSQTK